MAIVTAVSKKTALTNGTATKLVSASLTRAHLVISTNAQVKIGGSGVSESNGFGLVGGETLPIPTAGCQAEVWALSNVDGVVVSTLEFDLL